MILKDYVSPEVEIIEVAVEKGYASSGDNEHIGGDIGGGDGGFPD